MVLIDSSNPILLIYVRPLPQNPLQPPTCLVPIAVEGMESTRDIVGQNVNDIHEICHYYNNIDSKSHNIV